MSHHALHSALEGKKRQRFEQRIFVLHGLLLVVTLLIIGRLIELQVVHGSEYHKQAEEQQFGGVVLSAKRGEILSRSSKTQELNVLATNSTLDLLHIDPLIVTEKHGEIADELANILITTEVDALCRRANYRCPSELVSYYRPAFNPLRGLRYQLQASGTGYTVEIGSGSLVTGGDEEIPHIGEIRRAFAASIEGRIREKTVTFVPLLYGANKKQQSSVEALRATGINVNNKDGLISANPEEIDQSKIGMMARNLAPILGIDPSTISLRLRRRTLRYIPIMSHLPPEMSDAIRALKKRHADDIESENATKTRKQTLTKDPYRGLALLAEHWRYYPDTSIASHIVGFINAQQEPQYGIERAFDSTIRGQEGLIASVKDPNGGQIISTDQRFIDPRDGASIVLTIDRVVQAKVEELLQAMVTKVDAESGQVIIMDPITGKIIALANAPLFNNNAYATVYEKEPIGIGSDAERNIVVEIYNPENNQRVLKTYLKDMTPEGRRALSEETQMKLEELETLYDVRSLSRYYYYLGDNNRREIFPTDLKGIWLKYKNNIGVGSYVNRTMQEVYEPGSVMKPITMAIAIDQGEVSPLDIYTDTGAVKVDIYTIKNALNKYYGKVTMVDCIDFSINTCMTSVSRKLGRRLFHAALEQFGFGRVSGIELDNESPGNLKPLSEWNPALVMTMAFGQGITVTPIQMITAFSALANGGRLMKPSIIEEIRFADGTIQRSVPTLVEQVMKRETSETMTAMLTHSATYGFAKAGKVKGYRIAGKTGTSQIAGPGGKYESGTGSTVATYAGYAPVDHPKFVILVKLDRPKKDDFGSKSAAPLFKDIAAFLFEYYGIPPDEK